MSRLIDADALLEAVNKNFGFKTVGEILYEINIAPTVVQPQKQWVGLSDGDFKDTSWFTDEFIEGANWAQNKLKELNT